MRYLRPIFIVWVSMLAFATPSLALTPQELASQPRCAALEEAAIGADANLAERIAIARYACRLPVNMSAAEANAALGEAIIVGRRKGDALTVLVRAQADTVSLSGSLRGDMERIGDAGFWVARYRLAELDRAMIIAVPVADGAPLDDETWLTWRGPNAAPAHVLKPTLAGTVLEHTLWSESLGETRRLEIYLPPGHDFSGAYPALFIADGASADIYARQIEPMIEAGALPPLVIVGALSGQRGIVEDRSSLQVDLRAADYLPGFTGGGDRFEQHLRFFSEELVAFATREFAVTTDPSRRVVQGQSNGAVLAFWAAQRRPDVFGAAIVSSQAWQPVDEVTPGGSRARFFMNAGLYEQPNYRTTRRTAEALRRAGYDVRLDLIPAGHMFDQTQTMLALYLPLALAPAR